MSPPRRARRSTVLSSTQDLATLNFKIPCFAHQQLDPARFPEGIGSAIGSPHSWSSLIAMRGGFQGAWDESDDDEDMRDVDGTQTSVRFSVDALPTTKEEAPTVKRKRESKPKTSTKRKTKLDDSYKRMKVAGGRPATAKKVTADLDSDDELIMRMKNAKYLEKDIAQRLVDEGRIAYNPKTIGTRYARMMRAFQKHQDELLDADLTDWHDGDDDALEQAITRADDEVKKMKEAAEAKKWRIVANELKQIKPVVNFSQNACRNRYEALKDGTAKPTPESIPEPDQKVQERIESRREKQKRIEADAILLKNVGKSNLEGNSWSSRAVKYF